MTVSQFILKFFFPFKFYLLSSIFIIFLYSVDISLRSYLIKLLIDAHSLNRSVNFISIVACIFVSLQFAMQLLWRFHEWCTIKYEPSIQNYITRLTIDHISNHNYYFFQDHPAGDISSKIFNLRYSVPSIISTIVNSYISNSLSIIIAMFSLYQIRPIFALMILGWSLITLYLSILSSRRFNSYAKDIADSVSDIMGHTIDFLGNIINVKLFTNKDYELNRLDTIQDKYLFHYKQRGYFLIKFLSVQAIGFGLYQTVLFTVIINLYSKLIITAGDFAMILTINLAVIDNLYQMGYQIRAFNQDWGTTSQALEIIYQKNNLLDKPNAKDIIVKEGVIEFNQVNFCYRNSNPLFKNQSVRIESQQKVGLVGYSGGGKSSFINLILRLYDISSGSISIDNQDIRNVTQDSLHKNISIVAQEPSLFHRSVLDNIRYGKPDAEDSEIIEAAKKAFCHDFIMKLPHGYRSIVGERGIKLSGGQRQRVAVARAILKDAPILVLDEATSQLDSLNEIEIQISLTALFKNKTIIVIAHRLSTLLNMDYLLVFAEGKIVQQGTHAELIKCEGLYSKLWNTQVKGLLPATGLII